MSKKFFRPPPLEEEDDEDSSDEDDELLDDDDDDDEQAAAAPSKAANANLSESDEEEEEQAPTRKRKKASTSGNEKKRSKATSFFELEAEASDDDDEDDNDNAGRDGEQMDREAQELIRQQDRRRAQAGGNFGEGDLSVADMAREIENRHRMQRRRVDRSTLLDRPSAAAGAGRKQQKQQNQQQQQQHADEPDEGGPEVYTAVAQQSLVPSVSDPSFWMVSCMTGKEQELVFQIMNKCSAYARQGRPLGISAAIAAQSKGKIYIESFSEPAVNEAIQGIRGLMIYTMQLVPIQDMTTVMTVVSKKKPVKKNEWVRMTRGHYKGDLALAKVVKESGLKCVVQCVPRLDLTLADLPPEEARARRRTVRPPQKFFNPQEVAALGRQSLRRQRFPGLDIFCDYFEGNYYHDGYLLKEMTVGSMVKPCTDDDPPSLDELQRFQRRQKPREGEDGHDPDENEGSKMAGSLLDELSALQGKTGLGKGGAIGGGLLIGDTVEVIEGDLVGMRGKLVSLDGTTVKVRPSNTTVDLGGTNEVEFLANQVRKYIPVGAHVKVTDGRYANETGVVVAVELLDGETDFTAVVLTDVTNKEISVRTSQLRESAEVASGQDKLSGYELYDLVVLSGGGSANEVGVIVRVGREDFTVINNHGIIREARPEELRGKRNSTSTRAVALDVQGNQIRVGDSVNVAEGPHKGKNATIKRMSRAQLFLHSQTRSEHAGVFVVRSRSCVLAGTRAQNHGSASDGGVSPFATPQSQSHGPPAGGRGKRDDGLIGKTVRIQAGQWKGYLGSVADGTATHVQVELHSRLKKVMVVRDRVAVVGDKFGATEESNRVGTDVTNPLAPTTPFIAGGGATPMHGGATPMHGGATPMHDSMGGDDVWRPGAVDQEATETIKEDGWGSSANDQYNGNGNDENNYGTWDPSAGASTSTWGAPPQKKEETSVVQPKEESFSSSSGTGIKREPPKSEMETQVADTDETPDWFMERVCVQMKSNEQAGVIKEINPDKSAMIEFGDKSTQSARVGQLSLVTPKEHDTVLVTGGNEIGLEGTLVCVDGKGFCLRSWSRCNRSRMFVLTCSFSFIAGSDAILKDQNDEFKIIDFVHLVKIAADP
jgi:transcription elongation factor SPT5